MPTPPTSEPGKSDEDFGAASSFASFAPTGTHLLNALTELTLAMRTLGAALGTTDGAALLQSLLGVTPVNRQAMRTKLRVEALGEIAQSLTDEMVDLRSLAADDPAAALARLDALQEILKGVEKARDAAEAEIAATCHNAFTPPQADVWSGWGRSPEGEYERVPLDMQEEPTT